MIQKYQMELEDIPMRLLGNYDINRLLEREENLRCVETLLERKLDELKDIRSSLPAGNKLLRLLGRPIRQEEFGEIYDDISARVNEFLGVDSISRPEWALSTYFKNQYDPKVRLMFLNNDHRTELIVSGAHEYTHHVCKSYGIYDGQNCFEEGICRAAQRDVARQYSIEENNIAFMLHITELDTSELRSMYIHLAKIFGKPVLRHLAETGSANGKRHKKAYGTIENDGAYDGNSGGTDLHETCCRIKSGLPSVHSRGNVFYMLKESRDGPGFYKRIFDISSKQAMRS